MRLYTYIFLTILFSCNAYEKRYLKEACWCIESIEDYTKKNKVLPDSLSQVLKSSEYGIKDIIFYEKVNDSCYVLWFGLSLGESMIYTSDSKKWRKGG